MHNQFILTLPRIAWDGRLLVIGFASGRIPAPPANLILLKSCSVVGVFWGESARREPEQYARNIASLMDWWREGKLRPHISATYPLERAGEAIRQLAERQAKGKIIVTVG